MRLNKEEKLMIRQGLAALILRAQEARSLLAVLEAEGTISTALAEAARVRTNTNEADVRRLHARLVLATMTKTAPQ